MSSKETAAVSQLLSLLESRYAMRVLWALKDGHPQTFRLLHGKHFIIKDRLDLSFFPPHF
jgi:DNA-binding HxlR family transcriptional regulator